MDGRPMTLALGLNVGLLVVGVSALLIMSLAPPSAAEATAHPFLFGYTWHRGTWPSYVPDIKSAAQGGYGADQSNRMIEVGSGEAVINKHLENMYRLTGLMREQPGPVGFKAGPRYQVTPVPRDKLARSRHDSDPASGIGPCMGNLCRFFRNP